MPQIVRQGDLSRGHCFSPTPPSSWSPNVFANNLGVVRLSDGIVPHCCGDPCHGGSYAGVRNVYANGLPIQAVGDPISCGDTASGHSPNVYAGP